MIQQRFFRHFASVVVSLSALVLVGCGSTITVATGSDEIATLETGDVSDAEVTDGTASVSAGDVAIELSECLREQGLDVADISLDADGNIDIRSA